MCWQWQIATGARGTDPGSIPARACITAQAALIARGAQERETEQHAAALTIEWLELFNDEMQRRAVRTPVCWLLICIF